MRLAAMILGLMAATAIAVCPCAPNCGCGDGDACFCRPFTNNLAPCGFDNECGCPKGQYGNCLAA